MKHIVKKEFKIALLMIILILGTSLSPRAQIVSVQPVHFEGGFSTLTGLTGKEQKKDGRDQIQNANTEKSNLDKEVSECRKMNDENETCVVEYRVTYSVWSYYSKLVSHKRRTSSVRN